jgi:phytoene dehydrogenase-like protein
MSSILIIGGGVAGLSAGCYARMNGFDATILEMHNLPGGLCTAWKRRGFTIDGCVHWLVGSRRGSLNEIWRELGVIQGREFVDHDEYMRFLPDSGEPIILYTDPDRLEAHLSELFPQDRPTIQEFCRLVKKCAGFEAAPPGPAELMGAWDMVKFVLENARYLPAFGKYGKLTVADFARRFKDERLREVFEHFFMPEMPMLFMGITFAWLDEGNAGYPIGGSLPIAQAMADRFEALGGRLDYGSKVETILVENDRAVGVRLTSGTALRADWVVSAADGYTTIFKMLGERYINDEIRGFYENLEPFPPLVLVGLGFDRPLDDLPCSASGILLRPREPIGPGALPSGLLNFHPFNHDPDLAPPGKGVAVAMLGSNYQAWKALDDEGYKVAKKEIERRVVEELERRWPELARGVEMVDVATPLTFERYTGNWQGSFEGWIPTPANFRTNLPKVLPGLSNFLMAGHWVEIGGGLPPAAYSGKHTIMRICHREKKKFQSSTP